MRPLAPAGRSRYRPQGGIGVTNALLPLPAITNDPGEAREHLLEYGCARLSDVIPPDVVVRLRELLVAAARADRENQDSYLYSDDANQRIWMLLPRHELFAQLATNPVALDMMRAILGDAPLLSNLSANITGPGGEAMIPHWDQDWADRPWPLALAAHVIWMLDDFTVDNGATLVAPGSHRLDTLPPVDRLVPATGPAGSALLLDGRTWHGTGANTSASSRRIGILAYYCRPYIRQQENYALSLTPEFQAGLDPALRRLLGLEFYEYLNMVGGPPKELPHC
jgi:ectoine hydroxylase-related dioxygenase (phytanoyl-CoA dioxygenase family)